MAPLIPRIESAEVGSKPLAYLIRPGSDYQGDRIRCDTGTVWGALYTWAPYTCCPPPPLAALCTGPHICHQRSGPAVTEVYSDQLAILNIT